jgi:hypothetical protein
MFVASSAFAGTVDVKVGDILKFTDGALGVGTGGEFNADNLTNGAGVDFITYCVQTTEFLNFSNQFKVVGVSTQSLVDNVPLAQETAYLYTQFRNGTLPNYGTNAAADALQAAIWHFQGQAGGALNAYTTLASAAVSGGSWSGIGNVRIANLVWHTALLPNFPVGTPAQDVLVIIPLPPAVFAGLGLLGVVAVGQIRRRLGSTVTV